MFRIGKSKRRFGKKLFTLNARHFRKSTAKADAGLLRKAGFLARVTINRLPKAFGPRPKGKRLVFHVWTRKKGR